MGVSSPHLRDCQAIIVGSSVSTAHLRDCQAIIVGSGVSSTHLCDCQAIVVGSGEYDHDAPCIALVFPKHMLTLGLNIPGSYLSPIMPAKGSKRHRGWQKGSMISGSQPMELWLFKGGMRIRAVAVKSMLHC